MAAAAAALPILVLTHLPDHAAAMELARTLVTEKLAACVNIGAPVQSMYHWQGQIETAQEFPVSIKTRSALYPRVEAVILADWLGGRHRNSIDDVILAEASADRRILLTFDAGSMPACSFVWPRTVDTMVASFW